MYLQQVVRVQLTLKQGRLALLNRKRVQFLDDNARIHVVQVDIDTISRLGWEIQCHSYYSPDLVPTN